MFHYRLTPSNSRFRMLIAIFLAIVVHMVLISFQFDQKPLQVPSVSLPLSVSVFLNQRNMVETPEMQREKTQTGKLSVVEQTSTEIKPEMSVPQKISAPNEISKTLLQQPSRSEIAVKQPAVKKIAAAPEGSEKTEQDRISDPGKSAEIQKQVTEAKSVAAPEDAGGILPGTLQMAYPRYQLNTPPAYPGLARKRGQEGTVILRVLVNREGRVVDLSIDVPSNFSLLDRAALAAVRKWIFEPGRRGEERVPMWVRVPVTFKLNK